MRIPKDVHKVSQQLLRPPLVQMHYHNTLLEMEGKISFTYSLKIASALYRPGLVEVLWYGIAISTHLIPQMW